MIFNLKAFFKILFYKILKKKIIVINESAGLGDYIWVRNFFKVIKNSEEYKDYKIVFCATRRWADFATEFDSNYIDVLLPFFNPYRPLLNEIYILKIFKFDIFLNFRAQGTLWKEITNTVKAHMVYDNRKFDKYGLFPKIYNEKVISQMINLPDNFKHTLNYKKNDKTIKKIPNDPYCILVLGGYTQGYLTIDQILCIIEQIYKKYKIKILIIGLKKDNKIYKKIKLKLALNMQNEIINGCGKFKTPELPFVVDKSEFIVTTNTSIWHIALMLNKKTICFSSEYEGLHYRPDLVKYITDKNHLSNISQENIIKAISRNWE